MSKKKVFLAYAREHEKAHASLFQEYEKAVFVDLFKGIVEEAVDGLLEDLSDVAPAQTALVKRFRSVVEAYADDKGGVDHKQVIRAFFIGAKLYVDGLSDEAYDAVADELPDEIAALRAACDPDDILLNDD